MPRTQSRRRRPAAKKRPFNFWRRLKEISMFFAGKDEVHKSTRRLADRLNRARIPYAIVGGMAVNAHNYRRTTGDVDILLTPAGYKDFCKRFVKKNYVFQPGSATR